jgi:anti-sigma regulatory factor (Ser/Thr protein kinase)
MTSASDDYSYPHCAYGSDPELEFEAVTPMPSLATGPVLHEDALTYTPTARSVGLARRRAQRLVTEWGLAAHAADTALIVSELGTNALLHGCVRDRLFQVRLVLTEGVLRIEVSDPRGDRPLRPRHTGVADTFGRGLMIVDELASRWGTAPRIVGKTVFAELALVGDV